MIEFSVCFAPFCLKFTFSKKILFLGSKCVCAGDSSRFLKYRINYLTIHVDHHAALNWLRT